MKIRLIIKGKPITLWAEGGSTPLKEFISWNKGNYKNAGYVSQVFIRWANWQRYSRFGVSND